MPSPGGDVSPCRIANISDQPLNSWPTPSQSQTSPLIGSPRATDAEMIGWSLSVLGP
jgi:hypothetical protein